MVTVFMMDFLHSYKTYNHHSNIWIFRQGPPNCIRISKPYIDIHVKLSFLDIRITINLQISKFSLWIYRCLNCTKTRASALFDQPWIHFLEKNFKNIKLSSKKSFFFMLYSFFCYTFTYSLFCSNHNLNLVIKFSN